MGRKPHDCPFREPVSSDDGTEAICRLLCDITGEPDGRIAHVTHEVCEACCRSALPTATTLNPVIASLILEWTSNPEDQPTEARRPDDRRHRLRHFAAAHLPIDGVIPRRTKWTPLATGHRRLTWSVGLLTAPRPQPTIEETLSNLRAAGFPEIHVFAEPGSFVPAATPGLFVTQHGRTLGNLGNFYSSLAALYMTEPRADCFALFQDDIEAATGLREWCENEFWPHGAGLVSLFTPRVFTAPHPGWRILNPGRFRTFGAQAFVFRRDALQRFLADERLLHQRQRQPDGDDAAVGDWAARSGEGIAYHSPSLVQHLAVPSSIPGHSFGRCSGADAIESVARIDAWRRPPRTPGRVGLVGWNTASGLGYLNRDLARHGVVERWLAPRHPRFDSLAPLANGCRVDSVATSIGPDDTRSWLKGLDWVLFAELPYLDGLAQRARELGISVACIPMWEWTDPRLDWLNYVDLMICPTRFSFELFNSWKSLYGFTWDTLYLPWPVDATRIPFRRRSVCREFLFVNGTGGGPARRVDGSITEYRRKGMEVVIEAARLAPRLRFALISQESDIPPTPPNIRRMPSPATNDDLYHVGDVCVQPSRWEGLGLPLLECQAAGMPLVTTDAPPMNEYHPFRAIRPAASETVSVCGTQPVEARLVSPRDLASTLESLAASRSIPASEAARRFIVEQRGWETARRILADHLVH
jgi:glycosyltransferase involved in cell wall biosynthesis